MIRAEKAMFRPKGDNSLAARILRIKKVWSVATPCLVAVGLLFE